MICGWAGASSYGISREEFAMQRVVFAQPGSTLVWYVFMVCIQGIAKLQLFRVKVLYPKIWFKLPFGEWSPHVQSTLHLSSGSARPPKQLSAAKRVVYATWTQRWPKATQTWEMLRKNDEKWYDMGHFFTFIHILGLFWWCFHVPVVSPLLGIYGEYKSLVVPTANSWFVYYVLQYTNFVYCKSESMTRVERWSSCSLQHILSRCKWESKFGFARVGERSVVITI